MIRRARILFFVFFSFSQFPALGQRGELHQFIESEGQREKPEIQYPAEVREFYRALEYHPAWTSHKYQSNQAYLLQLLENAGDYGLNEKDYQFAFIRQYKDSLSRLQFSEDWIVPEIRLADAAIHFFRDIAFGNTSPSFSYNGLSYTTDCISIAHQLAQYVKNNSIGNLVNVLQPDMPELKMISSTIFRMRKLISNTPLDEEKISSQKVISGNTALIRKLYLLGLIDSTNVVPTDVTLKEKVKEAQRLFGLLDDGLLRSTLLKELNVPLRIRLRQLNLSINYYRWLFCLSRQHPVVVVNIQAAYLKVYSEGKSILEMRIIAGKPSTPTPTLSSRISEVVLYPYWTVPNSIIKELLPSIRRNPGYVNANNFQILNRQGKVMNPYSINWATLSAANFPYVIRQSTGCDNALGLLKLNFYNPYTVYLHDTPTKNLFILNKRFFSHGCMRMENPMELGHFVLKKNAIAIDTLEEKGCLRNQAPIVVPVDPVPVVVWYNPAGLDAAGRLVYFEDVYNKFSWMKER